MGLCFFIEALLLGAKTATAAAAEASRAYASGGGGGQGAEAGASSAVADPFCDATSFYRRFYLHEEGSGGGSGAGASPPSASTSASTEAAERGQPPPLALASPCPFLACIDLSFNYISEEGATALAEAVRMGLFPRLREVCVAQNPLDDLTGGLQLREACATGCRVVY